MNASDYPVYDFVAASQVERPLAQAIKTWMSKFNKLFPERWEDTFSTKVQIASAVNHSYSFDTARSKWTKPSIGIPLTVGQSGNGTPLAGLLVAERADLILLLMEILSQPVDAKPDDRSLTSIELSMSRLVFQTALSVLGEAWPAKETIPVTAGEFDFEPDNSRLFPPQKQVVVTGFEVKTSTGSNAGPARFQWVWGKDEMISLLNITTEKTVNTGQKINLDNVTQIQVEMAARLGMAELLMHDLLRLAPGAIVKLNQPIDEPLEVWVNNQPCFFAWPGQSPKRQSIMIDSFSPK